MLPSIACPMNFAIVAGDGVFLDHSYTQLVRGVRGYTTVYNSSYPTQGTGHVGSVYVMHASGNKHNNVELGWRVGYYTASYPGQTTQHATASHFWAISINWNPYVQGAGGHWEGDICAAPAGTSHEYCIYHIRQEADGQQLYHFFIDGTFVAALDVQLLDGWAMAGCERQTTTTPNSGNFWNLQKVYGGTWQPWCNGINEWSNFTTDQYYDVQQINATHFQFVYSG